jgi:hypothetical protein
MLHGTAFKEFRKHFRFRKVSIYTWSRHKAHIGDQVQAQDAEGGLAGGLDQQTLRAITKKLKVLAQRAEKSGKMAHAINAYATIGRLTELMGKIAGSGSEASGGDSIGKMTAEQVEQELVQMLKASDSFAQWLIYQMYQAGYHGVIARLAVIPTEKLIRELIGNGGIRARVRRALLEAEAKLQDGNLTSVDYDVHADECADACDGDENNYYLGELRGGETLQ